MDTSPVYNLQSKSDQLYQDYKKRFFDVKGFHLKYGTAGFRDQWENLSFHAFKSALLAAIYSQRVPGKAIGIIITASHNPIQDNGLQITDFDGSMLNSTIEAEIEKFSEIESVEESIKFLENLLDQMFQDGQQSEKGLVFVGHDTRPSGELLSQIIIDCAQAYGANVIDLGQVTTPMGQHAVNYFNNLDSQLEQLESEAFISQYFSYYSGKFTEFCKLNIEFQKIEDRKITLIIDGSNGIGGHHFTIFLPYLVDTLQYDVQFINRDDLSLLNDKCGADFINMKHLVPSNYQQAIPLAKNKTYIGVSFDGDADRVLYFISQTGADFQFINGDKITCLYASYIKITLDQILHCQTLDESLRQFISSLTIGAIKTAYANGASSIYMREKLNLNDRIVATGVKNSHPVAHQYDIGIYFEANGHGTFTVKSKVITKLDQTLAALKLSQKEEQKELVFLITSLKLFLEMNNQASGDAMVNVLCIESALLGLGITHEEWSQFYSDLESLNLKVAVKYQNLIQTIKSEEKCTEPKDLQEFLDQVVGKYGPTYRSFIRPSGTQDIVRLYTEGQDMAQVQQISDILTEYLQNHQMLN